MIAVGPPSRTGFRKHSFVVLILGHEDLMSWSASPLPLNGDPPTPEQSENYENGLLGDGHENRDFDGHERDFDGREKQH